MFSLHLFSHKMALLENCTKTNQDFYFKKLRRNTVLSENKKRQRKMSRV